MGKFQIQGNNESQSCDQSSDTEADNIQEIGLTEMIKYTKKFVNSLFKDFNNFQDMNRNMENNEDDNDREQLKGRQLKIIKYFISYLLVTHAFQQIENTMKFWESEDLMQWMIPMIQWTFWLITSMMHIFSLYRQNQDKNIVLFIQILSQFRIYLSMMDFERRRDTYSMLQIT